MGDQFGLPLNDSFEQSEVRIFIVLRVGIVALDHIVGASSFIPILVDYRANIDIAECRDAGNDIGEFSARSSLKTQSAIKNNFAGDPS